jgi:hypothetical protein
MVFRVFGGFPVCSGAVYLGLQGLFRGWDGGSGGDQMNS